MKKFFQLLLTLTAIIASFAFAGGVSAASTPWENSKEFSFVPGSDGVMEVYDFNVPAGTSELRFDFYVNVGSPEIYIKQGAEPTTLDYLEMDDTVDANGYLSIAPIANPTAGTWYFGAYSTTVDDNGYGYPRYPILNGNAFGSVTIGPFDTGAENYYYFYVKDVEAGDKLTVETTGTTGAGIDAYMVVYDPSSIDYCDSDVPDDPNGLCELNPIFVSDDHNIYIGAYNVSDLSVSAEISAGTAVDAWSLDATFDDGDLSTQNNYRFLQLDNQRVVVTSGVMEDGNLFVYNRSGPGTWTFMQGNDDCISGTTPENECITGSLTGVGTLDNFADRVTISGDYLAAEAWDRAADGDGASGNFIYLYHWDGTSWTDEYVLQPGELSNGFAFEIDMSGDYLAIGDSDYLVSGFPAGSIYFAHRTAGNTWDLGSRIVRAECEPGELDCTNDQFGLHLAIDGNYAIVGVPKHDYDVAGNNCGGTDCGAAYIYYNNAGTWGLQQKIVSPNMNSGEQFGSSVDIDGDYVIIGAVGGDEGVADAGTAYIFKRNGSNWEFPADGLLVSSHRGSNNQFGWDVGISGPYAIVGSPVYGSNGAIDIYQRIGEEWNLSFFDSGDTAATTHMGMSVAIDGNDYFAVTGDNITDGVIKAYKMTPYSGGGGGAVPEFSDYMIMMTIIIAIALMAKKLPKISGTPLTRA